MGPGVIERWQIGTGSGAGSPADGFVAFMAAELDQHRSASAIAVGLHEAVTADLPRARVVDVHLPAYRGKSVVRLLSWLVAHRLATADGEVSWYLDKQQGPKSIAALLTELGWQEVTRHPAGRMIRIAGRPPAESKPPEPGCFTAKIGQRELTFLGDYGVFSPLGIDAGTALLLQVAMAQPPVEAVADIGLGYGPLAIGLVGNGVAARAVGTEVDCVALWLARRNADANGVLLSAVSAEDPRIVEATALTVSNVPTHIHNRASSALLAGLAERAQAGRLLIVVHASLENRYVPHLTRAGLTVRRHPGPAHVVLDASA